MLSSSSRGGFTLVEIMIAMGLTLLVTSALYRTLISIQRLSRGQTERVSLQSNVRAGVLALTSELRELATGGGTSSRNDLITMAPDAVTYRAMRGIGFTCQVPGPTQITVARGSFSGYRDPQPGRDSAFLFVEGSIETGQEATWLPVAITAVSTTTACPGGRGLGMTLTTGVTGPLPPVEVGTPIRIYEVMELRLYRSDGESWLGARSVSGGENIQPLVGPLMQGNGLLLEYLDRFGGPTGDPTAVTSIGLTVRGISQGVVNASGDQGTVARIQEELVSQVVLRNALH